MSCKELHKELVNMEEVVCPFCNKQISKHTKKTEQCCDEPEIVNDNNMLVCKKCGSVNGYKPLIEFVDFHSNKHRFHRKSVYQRKYRVKNIVNNIAIKNDFQISVKNMDKIMRIFKSIGEVVQDVNINRKRMINLNFIIKEIFKMLNLPFEKVKTSKSRKTITMYRKYWNDIYLLAHAEIDLIIKE